jgi:hypothetical protein
VRILRARIAGAQPKRPISGQVKSGSFHDPDQLVGRVRSRTSIRRLFVRDPYNKNSTATVARFGGVTDQFTDNPNKHFDPSRAPGGVKEVSVASARVSANKPGKASRGHAKVFHPNRQTLFGGKTIKKRS